MVEDGIRVGGVEEEIRLGGDGGEEEIRLGGGGGEEEDGATAGEGINCEGEGLT